MPIVVFKVMMLNVNVYKDITEIHSLVVAQNVSLIVIVHQTWLVEIKNVKILVLEFAVLKLFVQLTIMFLFVHAQKEQQGMHSDTALLYQNMMLQLLKKIHVIHHHVK
jgi:hypothetical protein